MQGAVQAEGGEAVKICYDGAVSVTLGGVSPAAPKPGGVSMGARRSSSGNAGQPNSKRRRTSGTSSTLSAHRWAAILERDARTLSVGTSGPSSLIILSKLTWCDDV